MHAIRRDQQGILDVEVIPMVILKEMLDETGAELEAVLKRMKEIGADEYEDIFDLYSRDKVIASILGFRKKPHHFMLPKKAQRKLVRLHKLRERW